jgi:hypothetical protein
MIWIYQEEMIEAVAKSPLIFTVHQPEIEHLFSFLKEKLLEAEVSSKS